MIRRTSNFTGYFLNPERSGMGRTVVMAGDIEEAKGLILNEASEIYECGINEVTLLLAHHGEALTPLFNTELTKGAI